MLWVHGECGLPGVPAGAIALPQVARLRSHRSVVTKLKKRCCLRSAAVVEVGISRDDIECAARRYWHARHVKDFPSQQSPQMPTALACCERAQSMMGNRPSAAMQNRARPGSVVIACGRNEVRWMLAEHGRETSEVSFVGGFAFRLSAGGRLASHSTPQRSQRDVVVHCR